MSKRKINLKEILVACGELQFSNNYKWYTNESILSAMEEACRQILGLAAENAETEKEMLPECGVLKSVGVVNKQSILDTINQIE